MNNTQQGKLIYPNEFKKLEIQDVVAPSKSRDNSEDGGGNNMDDKYVTHTELELSNEKLLHHMDNQFNRLGNKIDGQKVWMLKELSATAIFIVTILGFLITIFEFLK